MKNLLRSLALIIGLLPSLAAAQAPVNMGFHTVYGRIGAQPGDTGPGQAVPFSSLLVLIGGTPSTRSILTTAPLAGGGDLSANRTFSINTNGIDNTLIRQSGALSLVGRSANSTGNVADIAAVAGSSCAFIESASSLICGQITTAGITANAVTNAKLATMPAATVKCNPTSSTANALDCPGIGNGFAELKPYPSQTSGATNKWNATDPFGNQITISSTQCQGVPEFLAAASAGGWSWRVVGNGTISCNAVLSFPTCFLKSEYIDAGVTIAFTAQGAATLAKVDSHENCWTAFRNQWQQNSADTGVVLDFAPTNADGGGNIVFAANYNLEWGIVAPATGGTGVQYDATLGGFIGNKIWEGDINGGAASIKLINPGSGVIAVEHNEVHHGYIHGATSKVISWGTSTVNQATIRQNSHFFGRLDPGTGASVGFDDYGSDERFYGLNIINETANATTGLVLESGACNNKFFGGTINATTAKTDSGGCSVGSGNVFIGVTNVNSTYTHQMIGFTSAAQTLAQASTGFETSFLSAGEGGVQMVCPYTGTFRNLFAASSAPASGQTLTLTMRKNNVSQAVTCTITGVGTSCNDTTHTFTCAAGDTYDLQAVTSATTGSISFLNGGIEFDAP